MRLAIVSWYGDVEEYEEQDIPYLPG